MQRRGRSSTEIAQELKIDRRTVEAHRRNITDKLQAKNGRSGGVLGGDRYSGVLGPRRSRATS